MRVAYEEMAREFARVLEKKGFAAQDAAATARCIVSMRVGDIMLAAAKAARKKKRKEGLPWRSIPSKA